MPARYRIRDAARVPGLLSLLRVPLAMAFPFAVRPEAALAVLVIAGLSDVLDGWYARRFHQVTPTGAVLDPLTDKLFVATVALTLVLRDRLPIYAVLLLATRDLLELPLVAWIAWSARARRVRAESAAANAPGKLATAFQFACVASAVFAWKSASGWAVAAAVAGAVAAALYWRRALSLAGPGPSIASSPRRRSS